MANTLRLLNVVLRPAVCDECGRECRVRHLVAVDEAGNTRRLGDRCAWKVAGIKPTDRIETHVEGTMEESLASLLSWMG